MYAGFVNFGNTLQVLAQTLNTGSPAIPDAAPTWRIYGQSGVIANGTGVLLEHGTITGVTNSNPAVITSTNSNLTTGEVVTITGVLGATGVNGTFQVTRVDQSTFSVQVAAGGAYSSGGTWQTTGLYSISIDTSAGGFDAGVTYTIIVTYAISSVFFTEEITFTVC